MNAINTNYSMRDYTISEQTKKRIIEESDAASVRDKANNRGASVEISEEGIRSYKESLEKTATAGLQQNENGKGIIFTDFRYELTSRLPSIYGEKDSNGEYTRNYFSKDEKEQNLLKAYSDVFSEIVSGYADGTRKTYVVDKESETGYRQLTFGEELDELDRAYLDYIDRSASQDNDHIRSILSEHTKKVVGLSGERAEIASEVLALMPDESKKENEGNASVLSDADKIRKAQEFLAKHDALYAEQMATVMDTINDGMQVAIEVAKRMSSGAKVSDADEKMLQEYNPQMYMAAKNAQMMAERKRDMSDESLIDDFVERHEGDRKDWTTELNDDIEAMHQSEMSTNTEQ